MPSCWRPPNAIGLTFFKSRRANVGFCFFLRCLTSATCQCSLLLATTTRSPFVGSSAEYKNPISYKG